MVRWTNASGDFNAKNPENWEGGMPQTIEDWVEATVLITPPGFPPELVDDAKRLAWGKYTNWPRPISVSERLPEFTHHDDDQASWSDPVLGFQGGEWAIFEYWNDGEWFEPGCESPQGTFNPTHWLPLPPKPE